MVWGAFLRNCSHEFSSPTLVWRNFFGKCNLKSKKFFLSPIKCVKTYQFDGTKSCLTCGKFAEMGKQDKESATKYFRPSTSGKPAFWVEASENFVEMA